MRVLITAFEPFGGDTSNITNDILQAIAKDGFADERDIALLALPVSRSDSLSKLISAMKSVNPDMVICLGQDNDRSEISIEKIAINLCCYRMPDNAGEQPGDEPVVEDGPAAYFSTLPVDALRECLTAAGIPANVSYSAGTYVCNSLFYGLMHYLESELPGVRGGFIHIPRASATNLAPMTQAVKLAIERLNV